MPCTVTFLVQRLTASGSLTPVPNYKLYLQPSRTDITYTPDGGTTWLPWQGDPSIAAYPYAVMAQTNSSGIASFQIPYTDTEVHVPSATPTPAVQWQLIDPGTAPAPAVRVWYGLLPSSVTSPKTLDALTQLGANPWKIASTLYNGVPSGIRRQVSVTFTEGQSQNGASWPEIGFTTWRATLGVRTADDGVYAAEVVAGSETSQGCQVRLSQTVPTGATVRVDMEVF